MSFEDCVNDAMDEGSVGKDFGKAAQARWRTLRDAAEAQGTPRHVAEQMAAARVKQELHAEAAAKKNAKLATLADMQHASQEVASASRPDFIRRMDDVDMKSRGIKRRAEGVMAEYLARVHPDLLSRSVDPVMEEDVARAIIDGTHKNPDAKALAEGVSEGLEWLRVMANEAGASIGKLDGYLPVTHNRRAMMNVEFPAWFEAIDQKLDWQRIMETDRVPALAEREAFMREVYRNIVFGKESRTAVFGRAQGEAKWRGVSHERVLHWKSADAWIAYNKEFGSGSVTRSISDHIKAMSRDIAMMRDFGPNPNLGLDYRRQLWVKKAADGNDPSVLKRIDRQARHAERMMRVMNGPGVPEFESFSRFMSTTRATLGASLLERAVLMTPADLGSAQMAAKMIGANPENVVAQYLAVAKSMDRQTLLQADWIADTWADPGVTRAMFDDEPGTAPWAQKMNNASMRGQGLALHSDRLRSISYQTFAGQLAGESAKSFDAIHPGLRRLLEENRITSQMWDDFRSEPDALFTAPNGAKFLMPIYWRAATAKAGKEADDLFVAFQAVAERYMELSMPSRSLIVQGWVEPTAHGLSPGNPIYEFMKSGTQFKSFIGAASMNMAYQWRMRPTRMSRFGYAAEHIARATLFAAVALQLKQVVLGNDPQDMTDPMFWGRALMASGGLAVAGDLLMFGADPNGMSGTSYFTGPVVGAGIDAMKLTLGNLSEAGLQMLEGKPVDTNLVPELRRFADRYLIPEPPWIGPAFDRLVLDQLQLLLDPESAQAMEQARRRQERTYGNQPFWGAGSAIPERAPSLTGQGAYWR